MSSLINPNLPIYAKSIEKSLSLMTVIDGEKKSTQSLENILSSRVIQPNTVSFGHDARLACTNLTEFYNTTYRGQGVVFQTDEQPDSVTPFDLAVLTESDEVLTQYYRIEKNIGEYYQRKLIDGYEQFMYDSVEDMLKEIPSPEVAWDRANEFRCQAGYHALPESKRRLFKYNEVIFSKPVRLDFVGIFGRLPELKQFSEIFMVPKWKNAKEFQVWFKLECERLVNERQAELSHHIGRR